jgi:hypothetical protein
MFTTSSCYLLTLSVTLGFGAAHGSTLHAGLLRHMAPISSFDDTVVVSGPRHCWCSPWHLLPGSGLQTKSWVQVLATALAGGKAISCAALVLSDGILPIPFSRGTDPLSSCDQALVVAAINQHLKATGHEVCTENDILPPVTVDLASGCDASSAATQASLVSAFNDAPLATPAAARTPWVHSWTRAFGARVLSAGHAAGPTVVLLDSNASPIARRLVISASKVWLAPVLVVGISYLVLDTSHENAAERRDTFRSALFGVLVCGLLLLLLLAVVSWPMVVRVEVGPMEWAVMWRHWGIPIGWRGGSTEDLERCKVRCWL